MAGDKSPKTTSSGKRFGQRLRSLVIILLALFVAYHLIVMYTPITNMAVRGLMVEPQLTHADVIVVLGGGVYKRSGELGIFALERVVHAVKLYNQGMAPKILFSGGALPGREAETLVMARMARDLKVPEDAIVLESNSQTTYTNAIESAAIIKKNGWKKVLLVTSAYHMRRSKLAFERQAVKVYPAPAPLRIEVDTAPYPRLLLSYLNWYEYAGLAYYKLRGWI